MRQDTIAIYCGSCGTREFAPAFTRKGSLHRRVEEIQQDVLDSKWVRRHVKDCGPAVTMSCADLHEVGGVNLYGSEDDSLVERGRGAMPSCPYVVVLLGGFEVPEHFTAARTSLLLPHWHRGCRMLELTYEKSRKDSRNRIGFGTKRTQEFRCEECEGHGFKETHTTGRLAILYGFYHVATSHKVGDVALSVVACRLCEQMEVVAHDLESPVGTPHWCTCEEAVYWGRRLL